MQLMFNLWIDKSKKLSKPVSLLIVLVLAIWCAFLSAYFGRSLPSELFLFVLFFFPPVLFSFFRSRKFEKFKSGSMRDSVIRK